MADSFHVELTLRGTPREAHARAVTVLDAPARKIGLRLKTRGTDALEFRPRVRFPFLVMLWHHLNRERMTVTFAPDASGGTRVVIQGAVARGERPLAADPEFWSEAFAHA